MKKRSSKVHRIAALSLVALAATVAATTRAVELGREVSVERHLQDGEEYQLPIRTLVDFGRLLFTAVWTDQEGAGRPLTKGTGAPLTDPTSPLVFPREGSRLSGPDANSCASCHNEPAGIPGGAGDRVMNAFVLGQRFDHLTFDPIDTTPTRGAVDENGDPVTMETFADSRTPPGLFGAGYIEMLARQMSVDLRREAATVPPGGSTRLETKGISFGTLKRRPDGSWDTSEVEGLAAPSLESSGPESPPSLLVRPFHQSGAGISLRDFVNGAFNQHLGIQSEERFGRGADPDGDGFADELTRADVTAITVFLATMPVPGRVIPRDPEVERAVRQGEQQFSAIGCAECHVPRLPLDRWGWIYFEPNLFNPPGNLRPGDAPALRVNLNSRILPPPRLREDRGVTWVPAFTDLKLHDISGGPGDPNCEPLDMNQPPGSAGFFAGNCRFLTRRLWGAASEPPYFHHGKFTTLREAILAHAGEAAASAESFRELPDDDRDAIIEFLKTLRVLPPGTRSLIVDDLGRPLASPPSG